MGGHGCLGDDPDVTMFLTRKLHEAIIEHRRKCYRLWGFEPPD
jgi:hypothetical protein